MSDDGDGGGCADVHLHAAKPWRNGNTAADAAAAIVITDTFDPRLTDLTVTLNGTALTAGTDYTYDGATFRTLTPLLIPAATYTRNATTGEVTITPGMATLVVTGTV